MAENLDDEVEEFLQGRAEVDTELQEQLLGGGGGSSGGKTEENGDETTPEALTDSSIERRLQQLESMLEAEEEGAYEASSATPRAIKNAASEGIPSPSSDVVAESSDKEVAERLKRLDDLMVQDVPSPRIDATPQASKPAEVVAASSSASPMASPQVPSAGVDERLERLENLLRSAATPREQQTPVLAATSTPGGREPGASAYGTQFAAASNASSRMMPLSSGRLSKSYLGGPPVQGMGELELRERVVELEAQLAARAEVINELMLGSTSQVRRDSDLAKEVTRLRESEAAAQRALIESEARRGELQEELRALRSRDGEQSQRLVAEIAGLKQQISMSEHRVRAKETVISRMQERMESEAARQQAAKDRDRDLFARIQNRQLKPGSASDRKTLDVIRMYESQRENMEKDLESLRREVRRLNLEVKDRENALHRKDYTGEWSAPRAGALMDRLEAEKREIEERKASVEQREAALVRKFAKAEERLALSLASKRQLEEENTNLRLELESRPQVRDIRRAQRRIHLLERKIKEVVEDREDEREADDLRRFTDTRELIRRDKENHRLKLHRLVGLSRSAAIDIIQTVCRILGINESSQVAPAVQKMQTVVLAVPRMQSFIAQVCDLAYADGTQNARPNVAVAMEGSLAVLRQWRKRLQNEERSKVFRRALDAELLSRKKSATAAAVAAISGEDNSGGGDPSMIDARTLAEIRGLVELERKVMNSEGSFAAADTFAAENPEVILGRIVSHFKQLFAVKKMDGVFPKMNELFLFSKQMETLLKSLRRTLGLSSGATVDTIAAAVQSLATELSERANKNDPTATDGDEAIENYVVEKKARGGTAFVVGDGSALPSWSGKP